MSRTPTRRGRASDRRYPYWYLALAASLVAACTAEADPDHGVRRDSIPISEEVRIGDMAGSDAYSFGLVGPVAPSLDGRVFVADAQVPIIRTYDAYGEYSGAVGGRGQGPGEYLSIRAMVVLDDGRLLVWDDGNQRVSWFDPAGNFLDSRPLRAGTFHPPVIALDGTIYASAEGGQPRPSDPLEIVGYWTRVSPGGETEQLHPLALVEREGPSYGLQGRGGPYWPFTVMTLATMGPDGSYYQVRNDTYRIRHVHPGGQETYITRDEPPVSVAPEEMEEWQARSENMASQPGLDRATFFPIPEVKPFIRSLLTDLDGRLWVSRYTEAVYVPYEESEAADRAERGLPSFNWRDRLRWDVYATDDTYLGSVTLPPNTTLAAARGDELWAIQSGAFREDYVVRYRMGSALAAPSND